MAKDLQPPTEPLANIQDRIVKFGRKPASSFLANPMNHRIHPHAQREAVKGSLKTLGWIDVAIENQRTGRLIDGHDRIFQALQAGDVDVPYILVDLDESEEAQALLSLDALSAMAETDDQKVTELLAFIDRENEEVDALIQAVLSEGMDYELDKGEPEFEAGALNRRFGVPPFSILDSRKGYWLERKRAWRALGIEEDASREGALEISAASSAAYGRGGSNTASVSVIDPVLCELMYAWFAPKEGLVINPTAGEPTYGIVAAHMGRKYKGVELRQEQIDVNRRVAAKLELPEAEWILGDGRDVYSLIEEDADFLMCCPPYGDLEVYSDDPDDLSTMEYDEFLDAYQVIIQESYKRLKENRFACFIVGDIRDKDGNYRNFVGSTIDYFLEAGAKLYNQGVLITPVNTLAIRVSSAFPKGRKLGKSHQDVLIFLKGDLKEALTELGEVEIMNFDEPEFEQEDEEIEYVTE